MTWQAGTTLAILAAVVVGLVRAPHMADILFVSAVAVLAMIGIVTPAEAFGGFMNDGVLTIAAMFIVAAGLVETGWVTRIARRLLGHDDSVPRTLRRMLPPVIGLSAVLPNTTVVAMALPVLLEWARTRRVAASKLLLPLSFATILGGVCTLIGTSTNLVVHGMLKSAGMPGFGMWELAKVGIPIAIVGALLLLWAAPRWLPDRKEFLEQLGESRREYLVEMLVRPDCSLIGQTVEQAGLRHLPGLFLVEIERNGDRLSPVEPAESLRAGDRLVFTGVVSTIVDLQKIPGLVSATDEPGSLTLGKNRGFVEAVISAASPLIGRGIREANFRTTYSAAVLAVHRHGVRLRQKIGDIVLRPGDTLLLLTKAGFVRAHRNNPAFYLVSDAGDAAPVRHRKAPVSAAIAVAFVVLLTLPEAISLLGMTVPRWLAQPPAVVGILAAGAMLATRCLSVAAARRSIDWSILVMIASAIGVGQAMERSAAADLVVGALVARLHDVGPVAVCAGIYVLTWVLTELMSNNAAAALMFPIAVASGQRLGIDPRMLAVVVTMAASGGFVMPAGYQTHLMVFGPGGYRLGDFVKIGLPMAMVWLVLTVTLVPVLWR